MRKIFIMLLMILLCITSVHIVIAAPSSNADKGNQKPAPNMLLADPVEKISIAEMEKRLMEHVDDILYLKMNEETVLVYAGIAKDKELRKRIVIEAPNAIILRLYTNNKDTYKQMYRRLQDYSRGGAGLGKYRVVCEKEEEQQLTDNISVYRFWFLKAEKEERGTNTSGVPFGIGIGIGSGKHHNNGGWVGIGG